MIIDFHSHYVGPLWPALPPETSTQAAQKTWQRISQRIGNLPDLLSDQSELGVDLRVVGAPPALVAQLPAQMPHLTLRAINDHLSETINAHPDRLAGLATVNAFAGEEGAAEVERAICHLGLSGIVIDCMQNGRLLNAPEAQPTLETAAHLGIPVLMHPVSLPKLSEHLPGLEDFTELLARGTTTAASLFAMMNSGTLDNLRGLRLVVPWLGGGGLLIAGIHDEMARFRKETPAAERWHIYVDTMGFEANAIRYAVDLLGSDHVLIGSDWPIMPRTASRERVHSALATAGLDAIEKDNVLSQNARGLLKT